MAQDSCRAVVGCADHRVYIYEMHSGKIMKTLTGIFCLYIMISTNLIFDIIVLGQPGEVTSLKVTDKDDFLLTAGMS